MGRRSKATQMKRERRAAVAAEQPRLVQSSSVARSRSSRREWLLVPVLVAIVAWAFFVLRPTGEPAPPREVPDPDLSGMPAPVATALGDARKRVVEGIDSAEAWGQFGMWLDAHHLYDHAESAYRVANELAPDHFPWAYLLAVLKDFQGADVEDIVTSFEAAMLRYGGHAICLNVGGDTWKLEYRGGMVMDGECSEHIREAAPVLSRYGDLLAVRSFAALKDAAEDAKDEVIRAFARFASVPTG